MANRPRAREIGLTFGDLPPGPRNALTDVPGVRIGQVTIIEGEGALVPGRGPVRTGVTAILPHSGSIFRDKVTAAVHVLNGFGKTIGLAQVAELGNLESPILLTNTLNVPRVADALLDYLIEENPEIGITTGTVNVVVGECNDGYLNDIQGRHVRAEHVRQALAGATDGPVTEGSVGAGTGMSCLGFKGGVGTSSRQVGRDPAFTAGVLVVANFGARRQLIIDGVRVGRELADWQGEPPPGPHGSIMMIVATDAPLSSRQLGRLARRAPLGLARTGSTASHGSGDFVIAFSTTRRYCHRVEDDPSEAPPRCRDDAPLLGDLFQAVVDATEEAVINSLFAAETMIGRDGHVRYGLPLDRVADILRKYNRI
ncbi:MAG: P1 family peptidase [Bacillota bacterium]